MDKSGDNNIARFRYVHRALLVIVAFILVNVIFLKTVSTSLFSSQSSSLHVLLKPSDRVLVTGAAGFIGYHLLSQLKEQGLSHLVGLDSFEPYYSPPYKYQRSWRLKFDHNIEVIHGSVCDEELLSALFREHNFTHVVHLSASANVRFSVEEPQTVIKNNIVCFQNLLEQLRTMSESSEIVPHLAFASSSSVYGMNEVVPFEVTHSVDKPASLYGASKRMNELQAKVYNHIFKIPSVGLRFFTVYGPWGRPDMAPYKFTEKISNGETITVYNEGMMKRDFTFVGDIVRGIIASMEFRPLGFQPVNLGNTQPIALDYFISTIEQLVGKKAQKVFKESNVDLAITYSSNTVSKELLDWAPTVSIEKGMKMFVEWFRKTEIALLPCASECAASRQCSTSPYDAVIAKSKLLTSSCETVIYAIRGVIEAPSEAGNQLEEAFDKEGICNILFAGEFTPTAEKDKKGWKVVDVAPFNNKDSHATKYLPKFTPQSFFSEKVTVAMYTSGKMSDLSAVLKSNECGGRYGMMPAIAYGTSIGTVQHAKSSVSRFLAMRQEEGYGAVLTNHKMSEVSTSLLVHDLSNPLAREVRCRWVNEVTVWDAQNDDLSLAYVLRKAKAEKNLEKNCSLLEPHSKIIVKNIV